MKKLLVFSAALLSIGSALGQSTNTGTDFNQHIIKLNVPAVVARNFSFQYEYGIKENMSVALGFRFMPKGPIPLSGLFENIGQSDDATGDGRSAFSEFLDQGRMSNWALTPEFRYYFGKQPLSGFYIAPYLRFGGFNIDWTYDFENSEGEMQEAPIEGRISTFSAGALVGAQWHLSEQFVLDLWIIGPAYGTMKINATATTDMTNLTPERRQEIEEDLSIEIFGNEVNTHINDDGIRANVRTPFAGLRTGVCIGFKF